MPLAWAFRGFYLCPLSYWGGLGVQIISKIYNVYIDFCLAAALAAVRVYTLPPRQARPRRAVGRPARRGGGARLRAAARQRKGVVAHAN